MLQILSIANLSYVDLSHDSFVPKMALNRSLYQIYKPDENVILFFTDNFCTSGYNIYLSG